MSEQVATMERLKEATGTEATMTVYRSLSRLGYQTSYSHRGRFYTLAEIPDFGDLGLWSCRSAKFSQYGSLLDTAVAAVELSDAGYTTSELELVLQVEVKHAMLQLVRRKRIVRSRLGTRFVYLCSDAGRRRQQELMRNERQALRDVAASLALEALPEELRAAIVLFFSLLDERQRRLFAGLEATKMGHGGDRKIADLLDLDPHTVAKGRRELFGGSVERGRVRRAGGGNRQVEKKLPR
jgi:hypothetical protein